MNYFCNEQVHRASLCVLDVETCYSIQLEQPLCVVLFAMQSQLCHLLIKFGDKQQIYNMTANQVAHVNCGSCRMLLMYRYGARSVKCAVCNFVTPVGVSS
ncbi:hypothetical protein POTOM_004724 [Populus tomentosa]|uniref:Zinc finger LSD1-type domain-containing protein n=1 Tax=Populus tomentosa TaxID=118781 RepID=A0A8X8AKR7_POPTO|nr:hypothetical protein POTOM_004724 [Populus tomentosa]